MSTNDFTSNIDSATLYGISNPFLGGESSSSQFENSFFPKVNNENHFLNEYIHTECSRKTGCFFSLQKTEFSCIMFLTDFVIHLHSSRRTLYWKSIHLFTNGFGTGPCFAIFDPG